MTSLSPAPGGPPYPSLRISYRSLLASLGFVAAGLGTYLIPAFDQIQQEQRRRLSLFRQEYQMLAMNFNRRSHLLGRIASEPDQKSLIRHKQYAPVV
jgi:hypothetical protein